MQGKVIKKTVPNEPIVRKKPKEEPINNEIIINSSEDSIRQSNNEEPKLKGARNRIKRNQPFTMNAFDGSSKSEKTETKPDGTIVRTIIEINGNQKKTTVITTKGGCTKTNTRIETVSGGSSSNNKGNDGFGFGRMDSDFDSGFGNFDKMWEKQVNQMNNFYNNFANFGNQKGYHYEYSSSSKGNKNDNKNNKKKIEWEYNFGDNNNKKNTSNKNDDWDYGWGTDNKNEKKTEKTKKYDDWDYGWGTDSNTNKKIIQMIIIRSQFREQISKKVL